MNSEQEAAEAFELLMAVLADGGTSGHPLRQRIYEHCTKWSTRIKASPKLEVKDADGNSLLRVE